MLNFFIGILDTFTDFVLINNCMKEKLNSLIKFLNDMKLEEFRVDRNGF